MSNRSNYSPRACSTALGIAVLLAVLGVFSSGAAASPTAPSARISAASSVAEVKALVRKVAGRSGAYVYDITGNKLLAGKNARTKRILASNTKLFTAAAALDRYGADGTFTTALWTDGTINAGVLTGDIYLRGGGDPMFGSAAFAKKRFGNPATAEALALNLRSIGVTEITGRVYGDETAFDGKRGTAHYGFRRSSEIGGLLSGLIFDQGLNGKHFQADPPRFAAAKMRAALKGAGIEVGNRTGVKATPVNSQRVAFVQSLPMSSIVRQMDKPSNNYLAEMLIKGLAMPLDTTSQTGGASGGSGPPLDAKPATTRAGASVARRFAADLSSRVSLNDGSGLSRSDLAAPREVVDLLRGMADKLTFAPFNLSLPIPGVDGTLYKRMRGTAASKRCHAKTGTLSNVSALSGYCTTGSGHQVAFSILQNGVYPLSAHSIQNSIVTTIARLP
jgi:D-alanyl-D-alanine carboxypeptidase/D-alanyl-D-alanine-endopeptidase (penicillin-binding protein 4)